MIWAKTIRKFFFYISVMAENQVKSREARVDFDEDVLEGESADWLQIT